MRSHKMKTHIKQIERAFKRKLGFKNRTVQGELSCELNFLIIKSSANSF